MEPVVHTEADIMVQNGKPEQVNLEAYLRQLLLDPEITEYYS